jgi:serpin B
MRRVKHVIAILGCAAVFIVAQGLVRGEAAPENSGGKVGQMNNAFAMDLYAQLAKKDGNVFFSPTSLQTALAMTWAGARGATAQEMAKSLHLDNNAKSNEELGHFLATLNADGKKGGYELAVANALWGGKGYPFMPAYLSLVKSAYGGNLNNLDFATNPEAARKIINDWVASQTHDKIQDLMPFGSIQPSTRLVLTNAIYFKGKWDLPFEKSQTKEADFVLAGGEKMKAPLMYQQKHFRLVEDESVQMLELPYGQNDLAMWVLLPKSVDGLSAVEKGLTSDRLTALAAQLRDQEVKVWLPRFKIESGFEMADVLRGLGMRRAFNPGQADFSGMASAERFFLDRVIHKAFVNVDEEGTEAAAATGITMRATAVFRPKPIAMFRADHPFVFAIVHQKSGAILFMGRLAKP